MNTKSVAIAALVVAGGAASAQVAATHRTDLQKQELSVAGREMIQARVDVEPGQTAARHSHPGEEVIYVLQGTLEYTIDGRAPVTLKAGDVYFIPNGAIHQAKNVGTGVGSELATYIVEKGKPLLVAAK